MGNSFLQHLKHVKIYFSQLLSLDIRYKHDGTDII